MSTIAAQTSQVYSIMIKATPEQVWDAITRPEFTERYGAGPRIELRDGRRYSTLRDTTWDEQVLESNPPHRLVHEFVSGWEPELAVEGPSRVTWEIEPLHDGVTTLTVIHDQLERAPKTAEAVAGGWMFVLSGLKTLLETGEPLLA